MIDTPARCRAALLLIAALTSVLTTSLSAAPAGGRYSYGPGFAGRAFSPPEIDRLERHAYDYHYRNSNGNVFRKSRQFHPTRNAFRSSRHYQRKLEASFAAYPLRTWVQFNETRDGESRPRSYNYAHPPADRYPHHRYAEVAELVEEEVVEPAMPLATAPAPPERAVTRAAPRRAPTQRAVMRTEMLPDGRVKTIIESVPIEESTRLARD